MSLKLFGEYAHERYGHKLVETKGGFFTYGIVPVDESQVLFVQDYYITPTERGFTSKHGSRKLLNKLKAIAKESKCDSIAGYVWLDSLNGNEMLRLFLYLGFLAESGNGKQILITYNMRQ